MKTMTLSVPASPRRCPVALAGRRRHAGPMHDRRRARGGARNTNREWLEAVLAEYAGPTETTQPVRPAPDSASRE